MDGSKLVLSVFNSTSYLQSATIKGNVPFKMRRKLVILLIAKFLVCLANPVAQNAEEQGEELEDLKYNYCQLPTRSNSYEEGEPIH